MNAGLKAVSALLGNARYEVIPTNSIEETVLSSVPLEVTLTVTASPTKGLEATIALAERLRAHGYVVVPHISARLVVDAPHPVSYTHLDVYKRQGWRSPTTCACRCPSW